MFELAATPSSNAAESRGSVKPTDRPIPLALGPTSTFFDKIDEFVQVSQVQQIQAAVLGFYLMLAFFGPEPFRMLSQAQSMPDSATSCDVDYSSKSWFGRLLRMGVSRNAQLAAWLLLALGCGFLAYVARMHEVTHDAFHEMALYREGLVLGQLPHDDVFAYTPTVSPSIHHEWATGAVLYHATVGSGLGLTGLAILKFGLMGLLWVLLYRTARLRGAHPYVFAAFGFIVFPVFWVGFATVRAQLFTLVFIAVQLYMQELDARGRRAWILLWLAMLVAWLNIHAGFVVGCGLIACHTIERFVVTWLDTRSIANAISKVWHLLLAAPAACLLLSANPYGWQYIEYLIRAIRMPRPLIKEWQPLWMTYSPGITLLTFSIGLALIAYVVFRLGKSRRIRELHIGRLRGLPFLALAAYMSLKHIRHGSIFAVVWIATIPGWLSRTPIGKGFVKVVDDNQLFAKRTCLGVAAVCLVFASINHFWRPTMPPERLYSTACYPVGAVEFLKSQRFAGNLLTPFHVGSYVSWEMYPHVKVSLDGRYEVAYQDQVMPEHNEFFSGEGDWWKMLDRYPTDAVLVHAQAAVVEQFDSLAADKNPPTQEAWNVVYSDASFVVLSAEHCALRPIDEPLPMRDGAAEAFSSQHAHWAPQHRDRKQLQVADAAR